MVLLIIGLLVCVGLALAVVAVVAVPARREGRELLTPQGEEIIALVKEKAEATVERTGDALTTAKDKVTDTVGNVGGSVSGSVSEPVSEPVGGSAEDSGRHRAV